jgi:hypothetical protein
LETVYAIFPEDHYALSFRTAQAVKNLLFSYHHQKSGFLARSLRALRGYERLGMTDEMIDLTADS